MSETAIQKRRQKKNNNPAEVDLGGNIPPQAVDLEEVVLGGMLLESRTIEKVLKIIREYSTAFYKEAHMIIYEAIS